MSFPAGGEAYPGAAECLAQMKAGQVSLLFDLKKSDLFRVVYGRFISSKDSLKW